MFDRSSDIRTFVKKKTYVNFPLDNILSNHFSTFFCHVKISYLF